MRLLQWPRLLNSVFDRDPESSAMAHSDSDDDVDDNDFEGSSDAEGEDDIDDDILGALESDLAAAAAAEAAEEASDIDEVRPSSCVPLTISLTTRRF